MIKTMKVGYVVFLLLILPGLLYPKKIVKLPEVMKFGSVKIYGDRLFVNEKFTTHIYSLKDFRQIKQFGKEGEGPGEFKMWNYLEVYPGKLAVYTWGKLILFTHDGKLLDEFKVHPAVKRISPVGKNFVVVGARTNKQKVVVCDRKFKAAKTIFEGSIGKMVYLESDKKVDRPMIKDHVDHFVYKDRIFFFNTTEGFHCRVFDAEGEKLYDINREYKKLRVTPAHKKAIMKEREESPGWERYKHHFNCIFPKYFPAYLTAWVADDKIYFVTYRIKDGRAELLVTDLEGKLLRTSSFPTGVKKAYAIHRDKLYHLFENEDEEMWELHIEELK